MTTSEATLILDLIIMARDDLAPCRDLGIHLPDEIANRMIEQVAHYFGWTTKALEAAYDFICTDGPHDAKTFIDTFNL